MSLVWESVTFWLEICGKVQELCVLETDCHASLYPEGTCFAARTGSQ